MIVTESYFQKVYQLEKDYENRTRVQRRIVKKKSSYVGSSLLQVQSMISASMVHTRVAGLIGPSWKFRAASAMLSNKGVLFYFMALFAIKLPSIIIDTKGLADCLGCQLESSQIIKNRFLYPGIDLVFVLCAFYMIRKEPDHLHEKAELLPALLVVLFSSLMVGGMEFSDPFNVAETGNYEYSILLLVGFLIAYFILIPLQTYQALGMQERAREMRRRETVTRGTAAIPIREEYYSFDYVLNSSIACNLFKLHLIEEFSFENYMFYSAVQYWKKVFDELVDSEREMIAVAIDDIYLCDSAELQINVYGKHRATVREEIHNDRLQKDTFDILAAEIKALMANDVFPRFKASDRYKKWLQNNLDSLRVDTSTPLV